MTFFFLHNFA